MNMKHVFMKKTNHWLLCFKQREKPPKITLLGSIRILNYSHWSVFKMVSDCHQFYHQEFEEKLLISDESLPDTELPKFLGP